MRVLSKLAFVGVVGLVLAAGAAHADAPKRKPGLWEISLTTGGQPTPFVSQVCVSEDDDLSKTAGTPNVAKDCSESSAAREGDNIVIRSVCPVRTSTVTTEALITGNMDSAYEGQIEANYSPPLYGLSQVKSVVQAKYLGPCK